MLAVQCTAETAVLLSYSSKSPASEQRRFIARRTLEGCWTARSTVLQKAAQNYDQVIKLQASPPRGCAAKKRWGNFKVAQAFLPVLAVQFTAETAVLLFRSSKNPVSEQRRFIPRRTVLCAVQLPRTSD